MENIREVGMEIFSDKLDSLLTIYVNEGDISINIADNLHAKIVSLFQDISSAEVFASCDPDAMLFTRRP